MKIQRVSWKHPEAAAQFAQSLKNTGFGVITDHPISHDLIRDVFDEWAEFFKTDAKQQYVFNKDTQAGYFPFRTENAKGYSVKDLKEFFHLYNDTPTPKELGTNTRELYERTRDVAAVLLSWIDQESPAEIKKNFSMPLASMITNARETLLRVLHYPPLAGNEEEGAIRAAAHEDINLITILPAATAPGLEVKDLHGNWHAVECNPCDLVINAGDMLQMASQNYYKSTTHRVVNPKGAAALQSRYSMPLFLHPRPEVRLSADFTAKQYLNERLREIGLK